MTKKEARRAIQAVNGIQWLAEYRHLPREHRKILLEPIKRQAEDKALKRAIQAVIEFGMPVQGGAPYQDLYKLLNWQQYTNYLSGYMSRLRSAS